jgi:hypothetical protein
MNLTQKVETLEKKYADIDKKLAVVITRLDYIAKSKINEKYWDMAKLAGFLIAGLLAGFGHKI